MTDPTPPTRAVGDEHRDAIRWNDRYRGRTDVGEPNGWLVSNEALLPADGAALDAAGGFGGSALWLAGRGFTTTLADISSVALAAAQTAASAAGLHLSCLEADLSGEGLPDGPWQVIHVANFLDRDMLAAAPAVLAVGGVLVFSQPTTDNLERNSGPSERFCLTPGETAELATVVAKPRDGVTCEVAAQVEGWTDAGTHLGRFVVRRVS